MSFYARTRRSGLQTILLSVPLVLLLGVTSPVLALDMLVNSQDDDTDNNIGDGECWTGGFVFVGMFGVRECTLRAAIQEGNALVGADSVGFSSLLNVNVFGTIVFSPASLLPAVTDTLTIDGTTAPTYDTGDPDEIPVVVLNGGVLGGVANDGLQFTGSAGSSQLLGIAIVNFSGNGIRLSGADFMRIDANHIGLDRGFVVRGNDFIGIYVSPDSVGTTIGKAFDATNGFEGSGNVIVGSGDGGVRIDGPLTVVAGNKIGTDRLGNATVNGGGDHANGRWGVEVIGPASNTVRVGATGILTGGAEVAEGNVIAGNVLGGILVDGAMSNLDILANHIGIGADGTTSLGNGLGPGIRLFADGVDVGRAGVGGNVIAGHSTYGIQIGDDFGQDPEDTRVLGNKIGTNAAADGVAANLQAGIYMFAGSRSEISENIVGGNGWGILLAADENEVLANHVGTNASGADLGNAASGIYILGDSNEVGREGGLGNVTGFNNIGIETGPGSSGTMIRGNLVGADAAGNDIGNRLGIVIRGDDHVIGGTLAGQENVVAHSQDDGIFVYGAANRTEIVGNFIGTNAARADLGNGWHGIKLDEAYDTTVGSNETTPDVDLAERGNVIAFNTLSGLRLPTVVGGGVGVRNAWRGNEMRSNGAIPIDLGPLGLDANDPFDADLGRNNLQNSPAMESMDTSYDPGTNILEVRYQVDSDITHSAYPLVVDFYQVAADREEPLAWLGSDTYLSFEAGTNVDTSFTPAVAVPSSFELLAIATDASGNSSEAGNILFVPEPGPAQALGLGSVLIGGLVRRRGLSRSASAA